MITLVGSKHALTLGGTHVDRSTRTEKVGWASGSARVKAKIMKYLQLGR
jgi:hypothetical protein